MKCVAHKNWERTKTTVCFCRIIFCRKKNCLSRLIFFLETLLTRCEKLHVFSNSKLIVWIRRRQFWKPRWKTFDQSPTIFHSKKLIYFNFLQKSPEIFFWTSRFTTAPESFLPQSDKFVCALAFLTAFVAIELRKLS